MKIITWSLTPPPLIISKEIPLDKERRLVLKACAISGLYFLIKPKEIEAIAPVLLFLIVKTTIVAGALTYKYIVEVEKTNLEIEKLKIEIKILQDKCVSCDQCLVGPATADELKSICPTEAIVDIK